MSILLYILSFIGTIAVLWTLFILFSIQHRKPKRVHTDSPLPEPDNRAFLTLLSRILNVPIVIGGTFEFLANDAFRNTFIADIERAKFYIHIAVYIWTDGALATAIGDALITKARQGVAVRLVLDGVGTQRMSRAEYQKLTNGGIEVVYVRPIRLHSLPHYNQRMHVRAFIIDGSIGYTGGVGFQDEWLMDRHGLSEWHDCMVRITGAPVAQMKSIFSACYTLATDSLFTNVLIPNNAEIDAPLDDRTQKERGPASIHVLSDPASGRETWYHIVWLAISAAQKQVTVITPYFSIDPALETLIAERVRAGVLIRFVFSKYTKSDRKMVQRAVESHYDTLLKAGAVINIYNPALMHAKLIVVDKACTITPSANFDLRSFLIEVENILCIHDAQVTKDAQRFIDTILARTTRIDPSTWADRGLRERMIERIAHVFKKQF